MCGRRTAVERNGDDDGEWCRGGGAVVGNVLPVTRQLITMATKFSL